MTTDDHALTGNGFRTRQGMRQHFDQTTRITLLEQDADLIEQLVRSTNDRTERIEAQMKKLLIGIATGAVLLALNLVVGSFG